MKKLLFIVMMALYSTSSFTSISLPYPRNNSGQNSLLNVKPSQSKLISSTTTSDTSSSLLLSSSCDIVNSAIEQAAISALSNLAQRNFKSHQAPTQPKRKYYDESHLQADAATIEKFKQRGQVPVKSTTITQEVDTAEKLKIDTELKLQVQAALALKIEQENQARVVQALAAIEQERLATILRSQVKIETQTRSIETVLEAIKIESKTVFNEHLAEKIKNINPDFDCCSAINALAQATAAEQQTFYLVIDKDFNTTYGSLAIGAGIGSQLVTNLHATSDIDRKDFFMVQDEKLSDSDDDKKIQEIKKKALEQIIEKLKAERDSTGRVIATSAFGGVEAAIAIGAQIPAAVQAVAAGLIYSFVTIRNIIKNRKNKCDLYDEVQEANKKNEKDKKSKDQDKNDKKTPDKQVETNGQSAKQVESPAITQTAAVEATIDKPLPVATTQGCGDWQKTDNLPTALEHPMPEQGKQDEGKLHTPISESLEQPTTGCGKPSPELQEIKDQPGKICGGMDIAPEQSSILKNSQDHEAIRKKADFRDVDLKFNENNKEHIFDSRPGHIIDTPENREYIMTLVKDVNNFLVKDKHDKLWFGRVLPNGKQLWAHVINNVITNCGLNEIPIEVDLKTGLARHDRPDKS